MLARLTRLVSLTALAAAALAASGCGNKEAVVTLAETEGIYVDVGELDYQVQLSRILNPAIVPDRDYFQGLPAAQRVLRNSEAWFAVFIRVQNSTDEIHESASEFEIIDTQENSFEPVEFDRHQPDRSTRRCRWRRTP